MIGAIAGDVIGSRFEWNNIKSKAFTLFTNKCRPTDDSVMSLAVAKALLECGDDFESLSSLAVRSLQSLGRRYPNAGYGGMFSAWLLSNAPQPYNSFGNGSAMRVSACAHAAKSLEEAKRLSKAVTRVTHNHPEGIKGAEAIAVCIFMAKSGSGMPEIRDYVQAHYYKLNFTLDSIRDNYRFDVTCQGSVPQAIEAFLESTDFNDAIRNAVSIGGDSDTIAAMTGSIAECFYGVPNGTREETLKFLDGTLLSILNKFEEKYGVYEHQNREV